MLGHLLKDAMFPFVPCLMCKLCGKFMKSVYPFYRNVANRKQKKKPSSQGIKCDNQKNFQIVSFIMPDLPWKFHENLVTRLSGKLLTDK